MTETNKGDYNFQEAEPRIIKFWEKERIFKFKFDPKKKGRVYGIDTPPPTVSGKMHIGHACSYSQQDFIARFHRMKGKNIFYPFGTDDNGLPTERLVEKRKNVKSKDMSREDFIKLCFQFLKQELPSFIQDWKNIGMSCDFDLYYSTINDYSRRISQWSFLDLYKKNRIYRKKAPFMYCPECRTAIAQYELKDLEENSQFVYIKFKTSLNKTIIIATTRPELLPACVAIHVNPLDKRYKEFIGQEATLPIFNRKVKIYANKDVDKDFGTGAVYHCTFGDMDDVAWIQEMKIPVIELMKDNGELNEKAGNYSGMKSKEARKAIIKDLQSLDAVEKIEIINHALKVHERCDTPIEILMTEQWFVKILDLKPKMLDWGAKLKFHPEFMKHRYDNWVKGLKWDWNISRQRFFGVPIPVWYCKKCKEIIVAEEASLPVNPLADKPKKKCSCGSNEFEGEKDIFDTWFTSSMTPRLAVELVDKKIQEKIFPLSLRPQAHNIITFWLFNTVLKSNLHYNKNPFEHVAVSGFVTLEGEKMSKSKGNIIEPQDIIQRYGADAIRFWAGGSKLGEDIDYQEKDIITGKKFVTKIWNATKFVFINLNKQEKPKKLEEVDRLLLTRLNKIIKEATESFESYEYSRCKNETVNFFWHDFCDNYMEIVKNRVYQGTKEEKESAQYVLYNSLLNIIKLMAPFIPFITEEIYQIYFKNEENRKSIHLSSWPEEFKVKENKNDEEVWNLFTEILGNIRMSKSKAQKSMKAEVILTLEKEKQEKIKDLLDDLKSVMSIQKINER